MEWVILAAIVGFGSYFAFKEAPPSPQPSKYSYAHLDLPENVRQYLVRLSEVGTKAQLLTMAAQFEKAGRSDVAFALTMVANDGRA